MLQAVASLLVGEHRRAVEEIRSGLEERFGIRGDYAGHLPHFSYQVAEEYDVGRLKELLRGFAREVSPFEVRTSGLGVFTGERPVLYVPIVRTPALSWLHRVLWRELSGTGQNISGYYRPEYWIPHITLAQGERFEELLPDVLCWLKDREFGWKVPVNNLALIQRAGPEHELIFQVGLGP